MSVMHVSPQVEICVGKADYAFLYNSYFFFSRRKLYDVAVPASLSPQIAVNHPR